MIKSFDFYFDFASPYSYIAHKKIRKIEKEYELKIKYMPILLSGLHKMLGITPAAFIPSKAKFMIKDCKLSADKNKIKFKFNTYFPFDSLKLMRGVLIAEKENFSKLYIDKIYRSAWEDGLNLNDNLIIEKILKNLDLNPSLFLAKSSEEKNKQSLKNKTQEAYNKGIFGVPSFIVNSKLFWGQDRMDFVLNEAKK